MGKQLSHTPARNTYTSLHRRDILCSEVHKMYSRMNLSAAGIMQNDRAASLCVTVRSIVPGFTCYPAAQAVQRES